VARITRKGKIVLGFLLVLVLLGVGSYYFWFQGLAWEDVWSKLTSRLRGAPASRLSDAEIKAAVFQALLKDATLRNQSIDVAVSDGVVTMTGVVDTPLQQTALEQLVKNIPGVKSVNLNLKVKPPEIVGQPSTGSKEDADRRLAKEVEFALYKTDAFEIKTMKIISRDGVVRLSGTVRSQAEKLLAERIAREVEGVKEVVNDLELSK